MDTRPVDRPPPTLRIKIYNRNTKTNNLFHIRHPAAGIIYSYLYPVNYTQTKKNDDRKTTSHLRYRYRTVPLRTRRRSRPERGRPDGRRLPERGSRKQTLRETVRASAKRRSCASSTRCSAPASAAWRSTPSPSPTATRTRWASHRCPGYRTAGWNWSTSPCAKPLRAACTVT